MIQLHERSSSMTALRLVRTLLVIAALWMAGCQSLVPSHDDDTPSQAEVYECSICSLHFHDRAVAQKCEAWCREKNSCNMNIAAQSLEAQRKKRP